MSKPKADRQESKQKIYKIDVRSIVENNNPRNPMPERCRLARRDGKPYAFFDGSPQDLWLLGVSDEPQDRVEFCTVLEMDEEFVSWAVTFLTVGQLEPVELRDNGKKTDGGNTYTTVFGQRRCIAALYNWAKLGGKGTPWINAVLAPKANQTDLLHRSIVENIRKDPSPMEGARAIKMALNQGQEMEEVGRTYGKSESWVRNMMKLLELPIEVQRQIEAGTLKPTKALEGAKKPGDNGVASPAKVTAKVWKERTEKLSVAAYNAIQFIETFGDVGERQVQVIQELRDAIKGASEL